MHELSVCQGLMSQVLRIAEEHGATHVERIVLQIGPLSGVEPHLLADAFPFASAGTPAEGAELIIESLGIRVRCGRCGAETEAAPNHLVCGVCGEWQTQLLSGDELLLVRVELLQPEAAAVRH
jgi:hydrogenase nickel incorporation protein HypA/HybF